MNILKKISLILASFFLVALSFADQLPNSGKVVLQPTSQSRALSILIADDLDDAQSVEQISGFHPLYFIQSTISGVNVECSSFIAIHPFDLSSVPSYIKIQNLRI